MVLANIVTDNGEHNMLHCNNHTMHILALCRVAMPFVFTAWLGILTTSCPAIFNPIVYTLMRRSFIAGVEPKLCCTSMK